MGISYFIHHIEVTVCQFPCFCYILHNPSKICPLSDWLFSHARHFDITSWISLLLFDDFRRFSVSVLHFHLTQGAKGWEKYAWNCCDNQRRGMGNNESGCGKLWYMNTYLLTSYCGSACQPNQGSTFPCSVHILHYLSSVEWEMNMEMDSCPAQDLTLGMHWSCAGGHTKPQICAGPELLSTKAYKMVWPLCSLPTICILST